MRKLKEIIREALSSGTRIEIMSAEPPCLGMKGKYVSVVFYDGENNVLDVMVVKDDISK